MITKTLINRYLALAITLVFTCTFAKAEKVISLNFGSNQQNATMADQADGVMDGSLAGDSIPANSWNDYSANSATDLAVTTEWDGAAKQTLTGVTVSYQGRGGNYRPSNKSTTSLFMNGYIDDNYNSAVSITVSGIPYATYDVIVYYQGDNGSHKFTSLGLNGKYYTYSEEALKVQECVGENGSYWGTSNVASPSIGGNALRVDGITGANLSITPWHSTEGNVNSYSRRSTIAAVQIIESRIGSTLQWTNNNTANSVNRAQDPNIKISIPATDDLIAGSVVEIVAIKVAERNDNANSPVYLKFTIGEKDIVSNAKTTEENWIINSEATTPESRTADIFTFDPGALLLTVGEVYQGVAQNANHVTQQFGATCIQTGVEESILWWNNAVSTTSRWIPVYAVTAKIVSIASEPPPIGPDVTFTVANDTDWAGFTLPTQAKEKVATGNVSFAGDISYRQTLDGRKATVALVTDAQAGNLIYGLHAFNGGAGLGAIDRDIYLMVTGGTPGVISGGEDANWSGTKTIPTGNLLVNIKGDTTVDYVYGAGLGGGAQNPLAKIDGNIGIVVEENAQVKGSLVGGWQSRHNATPEVTGNVSILVKNIQTHAADATLTAGSVNCVQGFIAGGGIFMTNGGHSSVNGNTLVEIRLPEGAEGEFMKHIVGAGHAEGGGDGNNVTGNSIVIISAPDSVIFPKNIMGGGHSTGSNKAKVGGNSSVTINGGTYTGTIYAAGDNGEHTLVSGTATLTITGGNFDGATLKGGIATGTKTLNVSGTTSKLNVSGFNNVTISSAAKLALTETVEGNLTITRNTTIYFPENWEDNTPFALCSGTLTRDTTSTGTQTLENQQVHVGSRVIPADILFDFDNKTIKYVVLEKTTAYTFTPTEQSLIVIDAADGGICTFDYTGDKFFSEDCVFSGIPEGYLMWVEGGTIVKIVKKTDSFSLKVGTRTTNKDSAIRETDESVGGFPVAGKLWNNTPVWNENNTATDILMTLKSGNNVETDGVKAYIHMPNTWYSAANDNGTGNERLTATYADDGPTAADTQWTIGEGEDAVTLPVAPCDRGWQIRVKNIPYEVYDLYIYVASDVGTVGNSVLKATAMALSVNGGTDWKWYAGDPAHNATIAAAQSNTWKADPYSTGTLTEGANYIKIRVSSAAFGQNDVATLDITHAPRNTGSNIRSSLAGIQIVKVDDDGIYNREADVDGKVSWTAEGMWTRSNGDVVTTWPTEGTILAKIDGDKTDEIKIDGVINATMVTLTNTAAAEGEEAKSFKFLTEEDLADVDKDIDPELYVLKSPVDATGFHGNLFLQSRIRGRIALGDDTNIKFVAGEEGVDDETNRAIVTTAFPYEFSGSNNPITKVGYGTFIVPSSMYDRPFHFDEGYLKYAAEGEITGTITGTQPIVIDAGTNVVTLNGNVETDVIVRSGTLRLGKNNPFVGSAEHPIAVTVEAGATLDLNGHTLNAANVTVKIEGEGAEGHSYALMNGSSSGAAIGQFTMNADATIGGSGNITIANGSNSLNLGAYKLTKAGEGVLITTSITVAGTAGIDVKEGGYQVNQWNNHLRDGTLHIYEGAYFQHNNDRAYEVKNVILDEGAEIRGATTARYLKISGELNIPGNTELNHYIMLNGAAIKGSGTLKLVEGGTLVVGAETTSTAALMLTQAGTLTLNAAISFSAIKLAADYSAAEIDGITNLSFDTLTLEDGATLDMTEKIRYPYYTLGATQNGTIKITTPTSRKRIAQVVAGYTSGITLVDENGEELDSCVYGGYLYYGTLCTDTEVVADEIAANVVYPSTTTVTGVDEDHYLVNDGKGGVAVATKTDSISINLGVVDETSGSVELADTEVGAYPVSGASWNNSLSNLNDGKGESTTMSVVIEETSTGFPPYGATANTVAANMQLNGNQKLTYGYLDNAEGKVWAVTLSNIPYEKFALYLIAANNGETDENGKISSLPYQIIKNNDPQTVAYYSNGAAGTADSTWNIKPYAEGEMVEGENFIKIKFNQKPTTLLISHPMWNEGVCTLAAIQIVEDKSEGDGIYVRRSDADLEAAGIEKTWSAANSWLDSTGTPTTWNSAGSHFVTIDAATVSEIKVDGKIAADQITVSGTAGENGFKFLTEEPLDEVADVKDDAPYRLDAPVSLIDFHGDVYLQSRITGQIQLGQYAHIVFVAMKEGEETTAYQYDFNGTIQPIRKIGPGTFVVPSSMYANIPFNITAGNICYDYEGDSPVTIGGALSGSGNVIKRGAGTIKFGVANNEFGGSLLVNEGAVDFGGKWLNSGKGYTVVTQAGTQLTNTGDANSNAAIIKSLTLEGDTTINGNSLGIGCGNDDVATAINLGANTLTLATTGHSYLRKTTISGTGKLVVNDGVRLIVYQNPVTAAEATLEIAAGSSSIELQGGNSALTVKNLSLNGTLTMPESGTRSITVTDMISGLGSIQNLTLQDGATVELGEEGVINVTGALSFGDTLKIKGGAFDKEAFEFTTEPTSLPTNVILVDEEGTETSGYYFNIVNGNKLVIASNEAKVIFGVVNVSDLLPLSTTRMKLTGDTVFVIDTVEGMPSAINFIADEACNLAFIYAAPYTGTLTFGDNITVEKKYAKDAWSLVPTTIGPGSIITIIGGDTEEEDFTTAITVQEGGVLHLERLIKLSAANNVNQGGTLDIVEDTTPGAPATFAKVHLADRGMKGTLNIGKNTTYYPFGYPDQPDYDHSTTVINVYGTLDMSDNSNARWTLRSGITINFYVGSKAVGDGQENASHHSAFQFNRADCVLNFLKDGETGGEIDFNLRLRPEHVFTMNIEEGVTVNMGGKLDTGHSDNQPFLLAGDGSVFITGEYAFGAPLEDPEGKVTIAEGGSLSVKSWIDYEFNENRTSIGTDTNSLSRDNNGNGFSETEELKVLSEDNKALYTATAPYRSVDYPGNWTAAIYGTLPRLANGVYVGFGNTSAGLALVNGEENVVKVAKMSGNTQYTTIIDVLVPEAHTKDHLYALVRTADSVELYVDGMLRGKYNETVTMNGGMQIGCVYQGVLNSGLTKFINDAFGGNVNNPTLRASHIDILRVYKSALGPHANETLAKEMSYTLPGGSYKRVLAENETYSWEQEGAWKKGEESASKPAELSEVEISVPDENVSAAIKLTETTNIGSLKISGKGMLGIVAENEGVLFNYGDTTIDGVNVTVKHNAVDLSHGALKVSNEGGINFDFSDFNVSHITERTVIPLTGVTDKFEDETISIRTPGQMPSRSMTLEYNETTMRYEVVISIDREIGEVVWNDEDEIAYGKSVLANGAASVLFPGDTLLINSEVGAANSISALNIRITNGGLLKLTGGQNPGTVQVDEGGAYDVNGGAVIPTTLKLNGGKLTNSAATEVQPLATTLEMMADSIVDGNVAFGALTLNGTGILTINEGASIKFSAAVTKSTGSELNVVNNGVITLTSGTVPQFNTLTGAGHIEFSELVLTSATQIQLHLLNNFNMPIHLKGINGNSWLINGAVITPEVIIDGAVTFNNGGSGQAYTFNKISGAGAFTLSTWSGCKGHPGLTYNIAELNNFTGTLAIVNNSTHNDGCDYNFSIDNIVTDRIVYSTPLVKLKRTITKDGNTIFFDISTVQLNGEETTLLMLEEGGIYHASATYNGTNYRDVNAAIEAAGAEHIADIIVYDANAILTGDYIIKNDDGVLSIVPVEKTEITTNTRVSSWTKSMNERLVIDGSANEVTVTFDAKIPEAIKEVRLVGNVKLVAENGRVIETSKLKGMEGSMLTILSDIEGDFEVKSAIKLDNVALSHAVMTDAEIEITGEVTLAGIRAASLYAHNATLKTVNGKTHKFLESRTMKIAGTVVIDSTLEIAAGATLTVNAETAATLKILKSKIGDGAVSLTENVTLYIPEGVQVLNVQGTGKIDGAGLISNEGALSSVYPVSTWSGTYWLKNISANPGNVAFPFESYANANSKLMLTGLSVWLQMDHDVEPVLILKDEGSTPAFTQSDSSQNRWYGLKLAGDGTYILNTRANSAMRVLVKECAEFSGSVNAVNRPIYFGTTGANTSTGIIVVNQDASVNVAKGKTWTATNGITINGTIKGSGTLASSTTFGATSIIDVSEGNLTLGAGVTLPETINIKGAKSGSTILAGVPAGTTVPKFKLIDNPGSLELKLQSDGQLVLVGQEVTITIPDLEHAHYEVFANGKPAIVQNGSITVDSGTTITVTYTPILGYVGGGSITTTIVNGLTPIRSDLISVKKGVKVIIREYKGANVRTIAGLDEDGIATEDSIKINGSVYSLTTPSEGVVEIKDDGIVIIHIKPNN